MDKKIEKNFSAKHPVLRYLAVKYIWWKTVDEALQQPERVVAQVMNIGDYDDVQLLAALAGDDYLREVLADAEIGQYNARSWAYWHYRLGLAGPGQVPAMPRRRIA
ncbi:MAG: hypothetical protein HY885_10060 [Deltaproteobacteria bacterium]|nr:hypothetical protein [Deltaproteobacteria bacterium]